MIIKCSISQAVLEFCGLNISVHMLAHAGRWSPWTAFSLLGYDPSFRGGPAQAQALLLTRCPRGP